MEARTRLVSYRSRELAEEADEAKARRLQHDEDLEAARGHPMVWGHPMVRSRS